MAWTSPRTWVVSEIVTAALLNTHLRDNLLATSVAVAAAQGDLMYATAANTLTRLAKGTAYQHFRMNSGATAPEWSGGTAALDVVTADVTVSNTITETDILSFSVPANTLGTNNLLRVEMAAGLLSNISNTCTIRIKYGTTPTTMVTLNLAPANSAAVRAGFITVHIDGDGATNAQRATGHAAINGDGNLMYEWGAEGTAAIDSTLAQTFSISVQHSAASTSAAFYMRNYILQLFSNQ